jgi:hypothetical protein
MAWSRQPDPFSTAVDDLLASPHFGERMASDWLDLARYADTHGFNNDVMRSMWRWRDWVIHAFNENLPYDRFITEQLAGDLLPNPTLDQLIATGFNRNHGINSEGGIIDEEYRVEYVADRVRTTSISWLGLTMECARCHDHKFDPSHKRTSIDFLPSLITSTKREKTADSLTPRQLSRLPRRFGKRTWHNSARPLAEPKEKCKPHWLRRTGRKWTANGH